MARAGRIASILLLLVFAGMVYTSCSTADHKSLVMADATWSDSSALQHQFDVAADGKYNIYVELIHDEDFPYANLWMKLNIKGPSSGAYLLNGPTAELSGRWIGRGWPQWHEYQDLQAGSWNYSGIGILHHKQFYHEKLRPIALKAGHYQLDLTHAMRTDALFGVRRVAFHIEKIRN